MSGHPTELLNERMLKILHEEDTGVICLHDDPTPYAVPVSYAIIDGQIVIHGSLKSRKMDLIRNDGRTSFVVSRHPDSVKHHPEGACVYQYESVIAFGFARVVDDVSKRLGLLQKFKLYFDTKLGLDAKANPISEAGAARCGCIVIEIEKLTGRTTVTEA